MQTKQWKIKLAMLCLCMGVASTCPAKVIHVDDSATGANDGSSWADAYNYLQDALADANSSAGSEEILVAQGTYIPDQDILHPDGTGDREAAFQLLGNTTLKGGYAGFGEPDPNKRDVDGYETILSGDLNGDDEEVTDPCDLLTEPTRAENCYHVVAGINRPYCQGEITVELDGFTISGGNANGSFSGLDSHGAGGGIGLVFMCYTLKVANCTFRDNSAEDGGAIGGLRGSIVNCLITNNAAVWNGGGLGWCTGLIQGCTMEGNYAENHGGAMYLWEGSPQIENCTFSSNRAQLGGGLFIADAAPNLVDCTFSGNSAVYGGGMHSCLFDYPSNPTLVGCEFIDNTADSGGGMYNADSGATLTNCKFTGNQADSGGGGMYNDDTVATLTDCIFAENLAEDRGGGMYNREYSNSTLTNCTFTGNQADSGGGMYNDFRSDSILLDCVFSGNSVEHGGGGMVNDEWAEVFLTNCIFSGNSSVISLGGGMHNDDGSHTVLANCTFSGNSAGSRGGAISSDSSCIMEITNSILWGNTAGSEPQISPDRCSLTVIYSDIQGGWLGEGNFETDPCFADTDNDDYHLKSQAGRYDLATQTWVIDDVSSPCIDAGDPMSPIGPEPFPNGGIVNMGAFGGTSEASKSHFGGPPCEIIVAGDINGDCEVDFLDFRLMALHWMMEN